MRIFLTHLDNAVSEEKLESIRKDVTYYILTHPNVLRGMFKEDLNLTNDHVKPERLSFGISLEVMPREIKSRRASKKEKEQQVFKELAGILTLNETLYGKKERVF